MGRVCTAAEIPLPNEQARMEIMKIHAAPIAKHGEIGLCRLSVILVISVIFASAIISEFLCCFYIWYGYIEISSSVTSGYLQSLVC